MGAIEGPAPEAEVGGPRGRQGIGGRMVTVARRRAAL